MEITIKVREKKVYAIIETAIKDYFDNPDNPHIKDLIRPYINRRLDQISNKALKSIFKDQVLRLVSKDMLDSTLNADAATVNTLSQSLVSVFQGSKVVKKTIHKEVSNFIQSKIKH